MMKRRERSERVSVSAPVSPNTIQFHSFKNSIFTKKPSNLDSQAFLTEKSMCSPANTNSWSACQLYFHSKLMDCHSSHKPGSYEFSQSKTIYHGLLSPRWADRIEVSAPAKQRIRPWTVMSSVLPLYQAQLPCAEGWTVSEGRPGRGCPLLTPCAKSTENQEILCLQLDRYL